MTAKIKPLDRVYDSLFGGWRVVDRMDDILVYFLDGGVMGVEECEVVFPAELIKGN